MRELQRLRGVARRGDEDAFLGPLPRQCAVERLDLGPPDRALPTLGLHIDLFQPEPVQRNDPVDARIARAADALQIRPVGPIAHTVQQVEHQRLEERRLDDSPP